MAGPEEVSAIALLGSDRRFQEILVAVAVNKETLVDTPMQLSRKRPNSLEFPLGILHAAHDAPWVLVRSGHLIFNEPVGPGWNGQCICDGSPGIDWSEST